MSYYIVTVTYCSANIKFVLSFMKLDLKFYIFCLYRVIGIESEILELNTLSMQKFIMMAQLMILF